MSGAILPLKTYSSAGTPIWAGAAAGGGGGGGGATVQASTIAMTNGVISGVSTISGTGSLSTVNVGPGGLFVYTNGFADENSGFEVYKGGGNTTVAQADYDPSVGGGAYIGARGYSTISGSQVIDTIFTMGTDNTRTGIIRMNHEFAGISTMGQVLFQPTGDMLIQALAPASGGANSAIALGGLTSSITFYPQLAQACHSKVPVSTNTYVPQAGTTQNLGAFATTAGHTYDVRLPVRLDAVTQPAAGDWAVITTDTANAPVSLGTFELTQVSSVGNQYETHLCGTVVASGATTTIQALGKPSAGTSTAVTVAGSLAFIRDLGIPQAQ